MKNRTLFVKPEDIRKIQDIEKGILSSFIAICEKHNLTYYLYGGTLLGCIRNGGFIPWDDDIDVSMPLNDYLVFLSIAQNELPYYYFLQTTKTDRYYSLPYSKIRDTRTSFVEMTTRKRKRMVGGVFIDIMPMYPVESEYLKPIEKFYLFLLKHRIMFSYSSISYHFVKHIFKKIALFFISIPLIFFTPNKTAEKIERFWEAKSNLATFRFYKLPGKRIFDRNLYCSVVKKDFDDLIACVPNEYDRLLKQLYGQYMVLPSLDKRHPCHYVFSYNIGKKYGTL